MQKTSPKLFKSFKLSFTVVSLLVLGCYASLAAIANAQTTTTPERALTATASRTSSSTPATSTTSPARTQAVTTPAVPQRPAVTAARAQLTQAGQTRVINLAANISNRLEAILGRLTVIADRVEARRNIIAASGADVSAADQLLAESRATLTRAQTTLREIDSEIVAAATAPNPRAAWQRVRGIYESARSELIAARTSLTQAVASLKALDTLQ